VKRVDVLVGAGPAGSATALRLACGGAGVLLAERARFPRDKPCGGGVAGRALRHAPCSIDPVVEDEVHTFDFASGTGGRSSGGATGRWCS
jgi:flavin-dependent dehydrogenase